MIKWIKYVMDNGEFIDEVAVFIVLVLIGVMGLSSLLYLTIFF